jgi:glycosyltransferase involved in cell wall biosynthesis
VTGGAAVPRVVVCRSVPVAPDPRVERLAEVLVGAGAHVTVVGWDRGWSLQPEEERNGYRLVHLGVRAGFGRGLRNLPGHLAFAGLLFRWLVANRRRFDVIHACNLDVALPALFVARACRKGLVFDVFDSYWQAFRLGPAVFRRLVRAMERWVAEHCDAVVVPDEVRMEQLGDVQARRIYVVYNSPPDYVARLAADAAGRAGGGGFCIAYVGLLEVTRGLPVLLEVVGRRPQWHLELAGFGAHEGLITAKAAGLPNVRWHGRVSYKRAMELMANADVIVACYDPGVPNHRYASPHKVFEAMMLAKPVVVAEGTHVDELVTRHECGMVVPYGDGGRLEGALAALAASPELRAYLGRAGRKAYETFYRWDLMVTRILELYRTL